MSFGRAVPWSSWEEWQRVGDWLLSADPVSVQKGLDRVSAWRVRGRVPLGVDSTACFVETRLSQKNGELSQLSLRMQYSLAVVRMVNGIADSSQKGRVAASVASLASAAGLPRLLVDLRHEATHNELPSLPALQLAAHHALDWLRTNYWQRQKEHVDVNRTKITKLVNDYVASHMAAAQKAAAVAAAVAQLPEDSGSSDDFGPSETPVGPPSGEYNVAAARKLRQSLLTELRVAVPRPAAGLLIDGLLEAQKSASDDAPSAVVVRALTHAMKHLQEGWPQLTVLLLESAALALSPSFSRVLASHEKDSYSPPGGDVDWGLWLEVLRPVNGGSFLPEAAARSILATTLTSFSAHAQSRLLRWAAGDNPSSQDSTESRQMAALHTLLDVALRHVKDSGLEARCRQLVASYEHEQEDASGIRTTFLGGDQGALPGSNPTASTSDMQHSSHVSLVAHRNGKRKRGDGGLLEDKDDDEDGSSTPRWKICKEWLPCAVGMIPSAVDPNGKLPCLEIASRAPSAKNLVQFQGSIDDVGAMENAKNEAFVGGERAVHADDGRKKELEGRWTEGSEPDVLKGGPSARDLVFKGPGAGVEEEERAGSPAGHCPPPPMVLPII